MHEHRKNLSIDSLPIIPFINCASIVDAYFRRYGAKFPLYHFQKVFMIVSTSSFSNGTGEWKLKSAWNPSQSNVDVMQITFTYCFPFRSTTSHFILRWILTLAAKCSFALKWIVSRKMTFPVQMNTYSLLQSNLLWLGMVQLVALLQRHRNNNQIQAREWSNPPQCTSCLVSNLCVQEKYFCSSLRNVMKFDLRWIYLTVRTLTFRRPSMRMLEPVPLK